MRVVKREIEEYRTQDATFFAQDHYVYIRIETSGHTEKFSNRIQNPKTATETAEYYAKLHCACKTCKAFQAEEKKRESKKAAASDKRRGSKLS